MPQPGDEDGAPRVLYVCHAYPPEDHSGTPLITQGYARHAVRTGGAAAVLYGSRRGPAERLSPGAPAQPGEPLLLPMAPVAGDWQAWALTDSSELPLAPSLTAAIAAFRPEIVHVVDRIGLPESLMIFLRGLGVPMLRHVCNMDEVCLFVEPVRFHPDGAPCRPPLTASRCAECLVRRRPVRLEVVAPIDEVIARLSALRADEIARATSLIGARWTRALHGLRQDAAAVVFPSQSFQSYASGFLDLSGQGVEVIEHGIPRPGHQIPVAGQCEGEGFHVVFPGPCTPLKGWDAVEACFERLSREAPGRVRLTAYGAGEIGSGGRLAGMPGVTLHGRYGPDALDAVLGCADIGLVPSRFETFNRTCREMLVRGVPVIGSMAFGIPDAVTDGWNGLLTDAVTGDALYAAFRRLLDDPGLLGRLREGAARTRLPTPDEEFAAILGLYRKLLAATAGA